MIIRTVYRIAKDITQSIQCSFINAPKMKYENFFKQIQKSSNPIETIRVYDQYREESMKNDEFIAITLRILTRSIRVGENDDPEAVKGFFLRNLSRIKKINLKTLNSQYIKDIIIFYVNFAQHFQLKQEQVEILNLCLHEFLVRFSQANNQKEIQLYSTVIFLSIPLTHRYSQTYYQKYLNIVHELLQNNQNKYIVDHDNFEKILNIFTTFQDLNNILQKQVLLVVFGKLRDSNISQSFGQKRIAAIITCILHLRKPILKDQQCAKIVEQIYNQAEQAFLAIFSTVKMYNFNRIIPLLLQQRPQSPIVTTFYGLILNSINHEHQCKLDPRVVVMGISFLSRHHFYKYFTNQWAGQFVKMVRYYHQRNQLFFDGIIQKLFAIINQKILDQRSSFQLYKIIFENDQSQKGQNRKTIKKLIMSSIMHTKYCNFLKAQNCLLKANSHFRPDEKQRNTPSNSDKIDLHSYYLKICVYQHNQPTMLPGFPNRQFSTIPTRRVKFVTDIMCLLFNLKLNLAYANFSHIQVENTLKQSQITQVRYIYNKEKVFKTVVFESRFSQVHFSNVIEFLLRLYGNSITLQQNMSQFIKRRLEQHQQLSKQAVGLIYFFYSQYHQTQFIQLIASQPHLLQSLFRNMFDKIVQFLLRNSIKAALKEHVYVILIKTIEFGTVNLQRKQALGFFQLLKPYLPTLTPYLDGDKNQQILEALTNMTFHHIIYNEGLVIQTMQSYQQQLNKPASNWLRQKDRLVEKMYLNPRQQVHEHSSKQVSILDNIKFFRQELIKIQSQPDLSLMRTYLTALQTFIQRQKIDQINDILGTLKHIAFKQARQTYSVLFLRFAIHNRLFSKEFTQPLFDQVSRSFLPSQFDHFSQLSHYPIPKTESTLHSFVQQITLDPIQNILPFCLTYSMVANPSLQMRQFMTKLCSRYRKQIPLFFRMYLAEMDKEAASIIQVGDAELSKSITINFETDYKISVSQRQIKAIFEKDGVSTANWWNIDANCVQEGVYLLITQKILQQRYPNKQIHFKQNQPIPTV